MSTPHELREAGVIGWDCLVPGCENAPSAEDGICEIHRIEEERNARPSLPAHLRLLHEGNEADLDLYAAWNEDEERQETARRAEAEALAEKWAQEREERAQRREESDEMTFQDHVDLAAQRYVDEIFAALAREGEGGRNNALWRAATSCGRVIAGGHLTRSDAEARLTSWAEAVGLHRGEYADVIKRGLDKGSGGDPWRPALEERGEQPPRRMPRSMRRRRR
jgi:hypothetical protein